jgi:hypothetical protein
MPESLGLAVPRVYPNAASQVGIGVWASSGGLVMVKRAAMKTMVKGIKLKEAIFHCATGFIFEGPLCLRINLPSQGCMSPYWEKN